MKIKILTFFVLLAIGFVATSCSDDDVTKKIAEQHTIYVGPMHSEIVRDGETIDCGSITAIAKVDVGHDSKASITLCPFTVTVAPYNNMTITTLEDIVVKDMQVSCDCEEKDVFGNFEQMLTTSINGRESMAMLVAGNIEAFFTNNGLEFHIIFTQWGTMPYLLKFDYEGSIKKSNTLL